MTPKDTLYKGGVISSVDSNVKTYNSEFKKISSENGACIYALSNTVGQSTGTSTRLRALAALQGQSRLLATSTTPSGNAKIGVGITVENSVFQQNKASETGGAIFLENIKADIIQSEFK